MQPESRTYDVLVAGGGLSALASALTCARRGLSVLVAGPRPLLGWEACWGLQSVVPGEPRGLASEIAAAMGAAPGDHLDSAALELALDRLVSDAGVDVLYYVRPSALLAAEAPGGRVACGAVLAGKSGEMVVRARAVVDATDGAVLWQCAGTPVGPDAGPVRFGCYMVRAGELDAPKELGPMGGATRVAVRPTSHARELVVEFDADVAAAPDAQALLPDVLAALREAKPACARATVAYMAFDAVPLAGPAVGLPEGAAGGTAHPELDGLFAAGGWCRPGIAADGVFGPLLALGAAAGAAVADALPAPARGEARRLEPPADELEADVLVCGAGTAGAVAALAAAREGADTLLVEASACMGGIMTGGNILSYYYGCPGGLQDLLDERTRALTPLLDPARQVKPDDRGWDASARWLATLQMLREAGVRLVTNTTVCGADTTRPTSGPNARIRTVRAIGPGGPIACHARQYVDSTGDADLAAMAGAPFRYGREGDGTLHPCTQSGTTIDAEGNVGYLNFDSGYCDADDVVDRTRARRHSLTLYRRPDPAGRRLLFIAPLLGIRQGRQVVGEYTLTLGDETLGRTFEDVITYAHSNYDNHARDLGGETDEAVVYAYLLGRWPARFGCEVPFRCLVPLRVDDLLVACRGLSVTQDAHYQLRMMHDMQRIGEAAGIAAALCVVRGLTPRELPVSELQARLFATGALGPADAGRSAGAPVVLHDASAMPPAPPRKPLAEWADELGSSDPRAAVWQLVQAGEGAMPRLLEALRSGDPDTRFWASVPLAMMDAREAEPALVEAVCSRRESPGEFSANMSMPAWVSAVALLGRLARATSTDAVADVLDEADLPADVYVVALRALGRIGDPSAAPAVRRFLARDDVDTLQTLAGGPWGGPVRADVTWRIELAAAEALVRMGEDAEGILGRYRTDARRYVRRRVQAIDDLARRG